MNEQQIKGMVDTLTEMNVPVEKIDEFVAGLPKTEEEDQRRIREMERRGIYIQTIKEAMAYEEDWRKRAALAARIISLDLE